MFYIEKHFESKISSSNIVEKVDLEQINHLAGRTASFIMLSFKSVSVLFFPNKRI